MIEMRPTSPSTGTAAKRRAGVSSLDCYIAGSVTAWDESDLSGIGWDGDAVDPDDYLPPRLRAPRPAGTTVSRYWVPTAHGKVRITLFRPVDRTAPLPVMLYLHGGGWTCSGENSHDGTMRAYARKAGICVAGIDYGLLADESGARAEEQVISAADWLTLSAARLRLAPDRLALGGDYAGARLALATAIRLRDAGAGRRVSAMLLSYGDFGGERDTREADACLRSAATTASPDLAGLPPTLLYVPDYDVAADGGIEIRDRLMAAHVRTTVHVSERSSCLAAAAKSAMEPGLDDITNWLEARLG